MTAPRLTRAALLAALCAATLAACGGSASIDADELVRSADEICRRTAAEFNRIQAKPTRTAPEAEAQAEALVEVSSRALTELRELEPPDELAAGYERYLDSRERVLSLLEDGRDAAAGNDPQAYLKAKRAAAGGQAERLALARELGLRDCSRPAVALGSGAS